MTISNIMWMCSCHSVNSFQVLTLLASSPSVRRADKGWFGSHEGRAFWAVDLGLSLQTLQPCQFNLDGVQGCTRDKSAFEGNLDFSP